MQPNFEILDHRPFVLGYLHSSLPKRGPQARTLAAAKATGTKIANTGSDGSWDYIDGIVYNNPPTNTGSGIQFIQTEEGRAIPLNSTGVPTGTTSYHFEYNLTDNLGNVRVSFDKSTSTGLVEETQEDQYYAFGLRYPTQLLSTPQNRYLYNKKEVQTDLANQYDYGARFYDPVIGRWNTIDPLSEKNRRFTPYAYVKNNPIKLYDPDGMMDNLTLEQAEALESQLEAKASAAALAWGVAKSQEAVNAALNKNSNNETNDPNDAPSPLQAALLSNAVYDPQCSPDLGGYTLVNEPIPGVIWNDPSGFKSALYKRMSMASYHTYTPLLEPISKVVQIGLPIYSN